jgi:Asp-tRNA(Asn)/Glu-tRNA(Gln) amidotransferase A subunit family amidase
MLSAMAGPDTADDASLPRWEAGNLDREASLAWARTRRIAHSADLGYAPCSPGVRAWFEGTIDGLRADGWQLTEAHPPAGDPTTCWYTLFENRAARRDT